MMAADSAPKDESSNATVRQMLASMEASAAKEDWHSVEEISEKLRHAVLQVPDDERRESLLAVRRAVDCLQTLALDARGRVSMQLCSIKRGKDATRAYGSATGA